MFGMGRSKIRQQDKAARATLAWLEARLPEFSIDRNAQQTNALQASMPWRIKPLGELILLLLVLRRYRQDQIAVRRLTQWAVSEARSFDWHALAAYDPSAAAPIAMVADFFIEMNEPLPFERTYFSTLMASGYFDGMDRLPYREMDLNYCLARMGYQSAMDKLAELFACTAFGRGQLLSRYSIDDMYSLTHALFYLTDFGFQPLHRVLDAGTIARLRRDLLGLIVIMIRTDNCDVLGELLIDWVFCGWTPTDIESKLFALAFEKMLSQVAPSGAVPPTTSVAEAPVEQFADLYHTTLVAAMLFSIAPQS